MREPRQAGGDQCGTYRTERGADGARQGRADGAQGLNGRAQNTQTVSDRQ